MRSDGDGKEEPSGESVFLEQARDRAVLAQRQADDIVQRSHRMEERARAAHVRVKQIRGERDEHERAARRTEARPG